VKFDIWILGLEWLLAFAEGTDSVTHQKVLFRKSLSKELAKETCKNRTCSNHEAPFTLESYWKVSFESRFRKSTFERKLSGVNGPLSKVYHFRKWLSQNRTCCILRKSLSKVINFRKWTVHIWKFSFENRLSKATFERNFPVWKGPESLFRKKKNCESFHDTRARFLSIVTFESDFRQETFWCVTTLKV